LDHVNGQSWHQTESSVLQHDDSGMCIEWELWRCFSLIGSESS